MHKLLLAIDIGNTNIVAGLFDKEKLMTEWRMATDIGKTTDEYAAGIQSFLALKHISEKAIHNAIISSVVPPLSTTFKEAIKQCFDISPQIVEPEKIKNLKMKVDNPKEVGADRLVNAVATYTLYGGPCIIIDFGTATTFCAVSKKGEYLGGAITAGPKITRDTLYQRTAKLPKVELAWPEKLIGVNTVEAIQSGLLYGYSEMVEGMVRRFKKILGENTKVIATGGLVTLFQKEVRCFDEVNPSLTLLGLQVIHAGKLTRIRRGLNGIHVARSVDQTQRHGKD